jgi:hypothetical protein
MNTYSFAGRDLNILDKRALYVEYLGDFRAHMGFFLAGVLEDGLLDVHINVSV